jgi:Flp pilus assembly protein TadG
MFGMPSANPRRPSRGRIQPSSGGRRRCGQSLVEFVVVLPVMLLVLLMAIDFGRLLFSYVQITNAAREGAAYGITHPEDTAGIRTRALQETNVQADAQGTTGALAITVACSPQTCATAATSATSNIVTVTVSAPFSFLTPVIGSIVGQLSIASSATSAALGSAGVAATPPPCVAVPLVNGLHATDAANAAIIAKGLVPNPLPDVTTGTKNVASAQSPTSGTCISAGTTVVTYHYRP